MGVLIGIFLVLHGLVHLWFVVLSQRLITFQADTRPPAWTGASWAFTGLLGDASTRSLASALFTVAAAAFVASGAGIALRQDWSRPLLTASAVFSSAVLLLFWDGRVDTPVDKGLMGLLINAAILALPAFVERQAAAS